MSSSYQTQYYPQQPDNNNLGLLATGTLAGGGIATVAFLNDGRLLKDLNKTPINKEAINKVADYGKKKASEADIIRKNTIATLKKIGVDARDYSKEQLDQIVKQFATSPTGSPAPVNAFTGQTTAAAGYPVGYSAAAGVVQKDLSADLQSLYKQGILQDPSKQYAVRPTGQQTQQVKRKPFRRS